MGYLIVTAKTTVGNALPFTDCYITDPDTGEIWCPPIMKRFLEFNRAGLRKQHKVSITTRAKNTIYESFDEAVDRLIFLYAPKTTHEIFEYATQSRKAFDQARFDEAVMIGADLINLMPMSTFFIDGPSIRPHVARRLYWSVTLDRLFGKEEVLRLRQTPEGEAELVQALADEISRELLSLEEREHSVRHRLVA